MLALLFGLGITWALLGALGLSAHAGLSAVLVLAVTAVLSIAALHRVLLAAALGASVLGAAGWLALGGAGTVMEVLSGVTLHLSGVPAALPMVGAETAVLLAVLVGWAAFLLTFRSVGAYPTIALLVIVALLMWLGDKAQLLMWLLPAVIAVLTQLAIAAHGVLTLRRVMPMMTLATLVAFSAAATGGVAIPPMKEAADTLRQKIYDYFFFTDPRDVFSLAIEGYYPQGQNQLGGKAQPTERPVMAVLTNRRTYLRGVIKNEYTGRTWVDTTGGRRYLWRSERWEAERARTFDEQLPAGMLEAETSLLQPVTVSVQMLDDSASSMFLPQRVRSLSPGGDLVPYFNVGSEVFTTRNLQQGDTWSVQAPLLLAGDPGLDVLINSCGGVSQAEALGWSEETIRQQMYEIDPQYEEICRVYTTLPGHLQQELYDMARRVVSDAVTHYEQAFALQNFLTRNYRYTLDVEPHPTELDFVTNFLLQSKEGYCTYFASAMTVLCRMVGLPARYVEGYVALPDAQGRALVTGKDGHAWTEVYFAGFGWVTFDATPWATESRENESDALPPPESSEPPQDTPTPPPQNEQQTNEETPTPAPSEALQDTPTPEPSQEPDERQDSEPPAASWPRWLLLLALLAAAGRIIWRLPGVCFARAKDDLARWLVWCQAAHDALRVMGLQREKGESPQSFMNRLDASAALPVSLAPLGQQMALMFYGHAMPQPEEIALARQSCERIAAQLKWWQKGLMHLQRAFLPARKTDFTKA